MIRRRRVIGWTLAVAASLVVVAAALVLAEAQGSPERLRARKGRIVAVEVHRLGEDPASTLDALVVRSSTGLEARGRVRTPRAGTGPYAGAVLLGGVKRGSRIVTASGLDAIARSAVLVSLDYPVQPSASRWKALSLVGRSRSAAFDTVADVLLLLDYLQSRPDVAPGRLVLIGGSLGAVAVTVAGGVDPRPAAVVALYGGARLGSLMAHTLEHRDQRVPYRHWQALALGYGLAWLLTPLEPARYAAEIAPRPFLMVNAIGDSLVPPANVLALYEAARGPKELIWVDGEHVQPSETLLLTQLSGVVASWLAARGIL